jgi:hypothetical protein
MTAGEMSAGRIPHVRHGVSSQEKPLDRLFDRLHDPLLRQGLENPDLALFPNTPAGGDPSGFASFTQNCETKGLRGTRSIP